MSQPKKPRSPYYKIKASELDPTPTFQSRQTLNDVVQFNMQTIGRQFYYQRIVLITQHNNTSAPFLKDVFAKPINKSKCTVGDEKMTGLFILFDSYTVQILEGPEEMLNLYFQALAPLVPQIIRKARIVLNFTNINQRFFRRIIWRIAEFPSTFYRAPDTVNDKKFHQCQTMIEKVYELSKKIREEELDDSAGFKSSYLSTDYKHFTPDPTLLDAVLDMNELQSITDYSDVISQIPAFFGFAEQVWPIPHDLTPNNVFNWKEYDINLNFWQK